ncbi:MAG: M28 family peptidase [Planctomycetota bacterium]
MKYILFLSALLLTPIPLGAQEPTTSAKVYERTTLEEVLETITEQDSYANVQILAAPGMGGRGTLTPGFERAAVFVEEQLTALGYQPANGDSFRNPVSISCVVAGKDCHFEVSGLAESMPLLVEQHFVPVIGSQEESAWGEAVFIGYAIDAKKEKWRDVKKKDVKGKIVFAFTREPFADDPKSRRFDGTASTRYSEVKNKAREIEKAGGLALVLVPDPGMVFDDTEPLPGMVPFVDNRGAGPVGLQRRFGFPSIPVMSVSREVAGRIFDQDIGAYYQGMEKKKKAKVLKSKKGIEIHLEVEWESETRNTFNLAALLPGKESGGEHLILGAHLDHVGFDVAADNIRFQLRPGADDNASGSAALLEVAQGLAGTKPEIDVLFLWFTGEEMGMLGSSAYCDHPIFPLENAVGMLNMDMVGRGTTKKINIGGLWDRPGWAKLVGVMHKRIKSPLKMDNKQGRDLYARSDQYSFHQKGVDGLFFFEADLHDNKDYHQPTDIAETINAKKISLIAKLYTAVAWAVAYEGVRP